ncbi:UbiA prenyltransferase family [Poronia punctata]|nr:UbiA prenyltransferase family [Poronia punctata]
MGILQRLPQSWVPYAELIRVHKPAGTLYIYFPYLFGSLFASCVNNSTPSLGRSFLINGMLFGIAFVVRGIGCTWNDIVDRDLDKHVDRCQLRPLARGATSATNALVFMFAQYALLFALVYTLVPGSLRYMPLVVATGTFYPYAKRITDYAQLVLGISLSMGTLVGCVAVGVDPSRIIGNWSTSGSALITLMMSYVIWTMIYDTVYAFQDIESDKKIGNKAMSIRFENSIFSLLGTLIVCQLVFLVATGYFLGAGVGFYTGVATTGVTLLAMVSNIKMDSPESCWWWFETGSLIVGSSYTASLGAEYLSRLMF